MTQLNIVVLASFADSLILFRRALLKLLVDLGHRVTACAPGESPSVVGELEKIGVTYQPVALTRTGLNPLRDLGTLFSLIRLFRRLKPDLLLSYTVKPVIYGSFAARVARVPRVFSIITGLGYAFSGETSGRRFLHLIICRLYRLALARNRAVFFQNPDDLALFRQLELIDQGQRAVIVNGSGVDLEHFRETELPTDKLVFLLIARLLSDKGIYEYVEAARKLKSRYPALGFKLVGPLDSNPAGIGSEVLEGWRREGVIDYQGWTTDVRPVIASASVYVLPSYREGTPKTVLEAMAMGRPIVTTDAPGCRETVRDGVNGFKVPVRDAGALASAMERFVLDRSLLRKMGRESRKLAEARYDVHQVNRVFAESMGLV